MHIKNTGRCSTGFIFWGLKKMADPGFVSGLIGVGIDLLIKQVLAHINVAVRCRRELSGLQKLVEQIQPINLDIQRHRLSFRERPDGNNPKVVNEWLKRLNGLLEDASELVQRCRIPKYNVVSRYILSKQISKMSGSIQEHLERLPLIGLAHQLHQGETVRAELQRIGADDNHTDPPPLAIKVIGASMAGSEAPADWRVALQRLQNAGRPDADVEKKLYNRLRLSYDALCDDQNLIILQLCFLYIGAFKEDEDMYVDDVINLWIGEGLLPSEHGSDPLEVGRSYANRLLDRCLIEASIKDADGQVVACSMHDVLHDLALRIADCCFRSGKGLEEFPLKECTGRGRISLMENKFNSIPGSFKAPDLRAMLLSENINLRSIPEAVAASLKSVRVLDLGGTSIQSLPESFGKLKHLVCLRLARLPVKELPQSVTRLKELRILDLSYCSNLTRLPHELHKMTSLMYLDLTFCQGLLSLPLGASSLPSLQYLKMEKCWKAWQSSPAQGRSGRISLCGGSHTRHPACSLRDLRTLVQLKWLSLEDWGQPIPNGTMGSMAQMRTLILRMLQMQELPEDMTQMSELSTLLLHCPFLLRIPNWICDFQRLTCLVLSKCDKVEELPALQKLQCLRRLDIVGCWLLRELPHAFGDEQAFPRLESFWLEQTRALEELPALTEGAMPSLRRLGLVVCEKVKTLPRGFQNLKNLRELHIYSSSLLRSSVEQGGVDYDMVSRLEEDQHLEVLKEPVQETHLKQMEKRMGNKYWWDRLLKDLWMNFHII